MNGCLIPDTPIAVDYWKTRNCQQTKLFFLTHMHADHTSGLSSSWKNTIYCSEVSAKLLCAKFNINKSLVRALDVGVSQVIHLDELGQETMCVTPIDANHCPGAVMYFFEGYFGKILYTGDFRYSPEMFVDTPLSNPQAVDVLYLDNTYNNPKCVFPSKEECTANIIEIIQRHPESTVLLGMHTLGKEDLLVDIGTTLKEWIIVSSDRYKSLELLEMPDIFSTNCADGRIQVTSQHKINKKNMEILNRHEPTIAVLPTALYTGLSGEPFASQPNVYNVPYSDHSSFTELCQFVSRVKPRTIVPIVRGKSFGAFGASLYDHADMGRFQQYLDPSPVHQCKIPDSVKKYMGRLPADREDFPQESEFAKKITRVRKRRRLLSTRKSTEMGVVYLNSPVKSCGGDGGGGGGDNHDDDEDDDVDDNDDAAVDNTLIQKEKHDEANGGGCLTQQEVRPLQLIGRPTQRDVECKSDFFLDGSCRKRKLTNSFVQLSEFNKPVESINTEHHTSVTRMRRNFDVRNCFASYSRESLDDETVVRKKRKIERVEIWGGQVIHHKVIRIDEYKMIRQNTGQHKKRPLKFIDEYFSWAKKKAGACDTVGIDSSESVLTLENTNGRPSSLTERLACVDQGNVQCVSDGCGNSDRSGPALASESLKPDAADICDENDDPDKLFVCTNDCGSPCKSSSTSSDIMGLLKLSTDSCETLRLDTDDSCDENADPLKSVEQEDSVEICDVEVDHYKSLTCSDSLKQCKVERVGHTIRSPEPPTGSDAKKLSMRNGKIFTMERYDPYTFPVIPLKKEVENCLFDKFLVSVKPKEKFWQK